MTDKEEAFYEYLNDILEIVKKIRETDIPFPQLEERLDITTGLFWNQLSRFSRRSILKKIAFLEQWELAAVHYAYTHLGDMGCAKAWKEMALDAKREIL